MNKKILHFIWDGLDIILKLLSLVLFVICFLGRWIAQGMIICFTEDWQGIIINLGFFVITGLFITTFFFKRKGLLSILLSIILCIYAMLMPAFSICLKQFDCLSYGLCWDDVQNKCEYKDQKKMHQK